MVSLDDLPLARPVDERVRRSVLVWLLPIIVLAIGGWLLFKRVVEAPRQVVIYFDHGDNIIPNQTELKYGGAKIGVVTDTFLSDDLKHIGAHVDVDDRFNFILQPDTQFWLIKTRVSFSQVTGLETLVSGEYITFQFGEQTGRLSLAALRAKKPETFEYRALSEPPLRSSYLGGLNLVLDLNREVSFQKGAPIYFRSIVVGNVEKTVLSDDLGAAQVHIFIKEPYKHLIGRETRFYDVSGVEVSGGLNGVQVKMNSLSSLVLGGISLMNPKSPEEELVENFSHYHLYESIEAAKESSLMISVIFESVEGLSEGAEVRYKGIKVGVVQAISMDKKRNAVDVSIRLNRDSQPFARSGAKFWIVKPSLGLTSTQNIETLVTGRYIAALPGDGGRTYGFTGLAAEPRKQKANDELRIRLLSKHLGSIKQGVKIFYRGLPVGHVETSYLSSDARKVVSLLVIERQYAPLVREKSKFWNVSGIGMEVGLFSGAKIQTESFEALLQGGIAFATPDEKEMGKRVEDGHAFVLQEKFDKDWLDWAPKIEIKP